MVVEMEFDRKGVKGREIEKTKKGKEEGTNIKYFSPVSYLQDCISH